MCNRRLAGEVWGREKTGFDTQALVAAGLDATDRRLRLVVRLVDELCRFPRHLSQHVGGFVITVGGWIICVRSARRGCQGAPLLNGTRMILMRWDCSRWISLLLVCSAVFAGRLIYYNSIIIGI